MALGSQKFVRRRDEQGSVLVLALVILMVMAMVVGTLVALTATNHAASKVYKDVRTSRYAGDGAIEAAVNWAKDQPRVGREAGLDATDPACVYQTPTEVGTVTVSCAATPNSDSGVPTEGGVIPPEALLTLGTRHTQPGPQNVPACKGWWDTAAGWFANGVDPDATVGYYEPGALFKRRNGLGVLGATCDQERKRSMQNFKVRGNLVSAGRIEVPAGVVTMFPPYTAKARAGCVGGGLTCTTPGTRSGQTGALSYLNGTPEDSDPARPATPGVNPTDLKAPWLPIGFNQDGSAVNPSSMPVRTTAFKWDSSTGALTPTSTCAGVSTTIVFLPGWYRDASVLNNYTANAAGCVGVTFWFAPNPGADGKLLTDDDSSGAFYMDFRPTSIAFSSYDNIACGPGGLMSAKRTRWCIGGSSSQNPRVVVGTPKDWSPLGGSATGPGGDTRQRTQVVIPTANTVDRDMSVRWHNASGATNGAKTIGDGQVAYYQPDSFLGINSPSIDRAIRVRDFTPRVTGPPIDDPGYPKGRIYLSVAYGLVNGSSLNDPRLEVAAVSNESGTKNCGTFALPKNVYTGSGPLPATYRFTDAQAKVLADNCSSVDLINGLQVTMKVTGNPLNFGTPKVYFDGVKVDYESFQGASFPAPINTGTLPAAAKSDCDPRYPGAQLIFGGESHVYVADGSLEVCAGPFPTDPQNKLVTGVFELPGVAPDRPSAVTPGGGDGNYALIDAANAMAIDGSFATIRYRDRCPAGCADTTEGRAVLTMTPYSAPSGYSVSRIQARVSYNPKNEGCFFLWSCPGAAPQLRPPRCGSIDFPKNPDKGVLQVTYLSSAILYDTASGRNCLSPAELANTSSPAQLVWAARARCLEVWPFGNICSAAGLGEDYTDSLDGIELEITLTPSDDSVPRLLPASGCIVAYPNYGGGEGKPDCAVLRADTNRPNTDDWNEPWGSKEGDWVGRASVKGTIYAPSAAVEVDDTDNAYPLATRGAVLRHLRMSGFGFRTGYDGMAIDTLVDQTPTPRDAAFTACTQSASRRASKVPCDSAQGDRLITQARVRFSLDGNTAVPVPNKARIPERVWWKTQR